MRKFTAFLTSLLLIVSVFSLPVFAAGSAPTEEIDLTKKGFLTLHKYEPGADTDNNSIPDDPSKLVSGAEFTAYQVIQITEDKHYKVTDNFADISALTDLIEKDNGLSHTSTKELLKLIPTLRKKAANLNGASGNGGMICTSEETSEITGEYTIEDMELGIYLVVETGVPKGYNTVTTPFLVSIPEWDDGEWNYDDITVYPKNEKITVDKIIDDPTASAPYIYMIGDTVPYKVTSQIPAYDFTSLGAEDDSQILSKWLGKIKYRFIDTMSKGLTFNNDLEVAVGDTVFEEGSDYTIGVSTDTNTGETTITVKFKYSSFYELQGKEITLTYSATLNKDAVVGPDGNPNEAYVKYTSDPTLSHDIDDDDNDDGNNDDGNNDDGNNDDGDNDDDDDDLTETEHSKTIVYTYGLKLTKLLEDKAPVESSHVEEVEFSMSTEESGTSKMWFLKIGKGRYATFSTDGLAEGSEHVVQIGETSYTVTQQLHPDSDGQLVVNGLKDGIYYLTEEKTLKGYVLPVGNDEITINSQTVDDSGYYVITVNNLKQHGLPFVGYMGGYFAVLVGGIICASGMVILCYTYIKRKRSADRK